MVCAICIHNTVELGKPALAVFTFTLAVRTAKEEAFKLVGLTRCKGWLFWLVNFGEFKNGAECTLYIAIRRQITNNRQNMQDVYS